MPTNNAGPWWRLDDEGRRWVGESRGNWTARQPSTRPAATHTPRLSPVDRRRRIDRSRPISLTDSIPAAFEAATHARPFRCLEPALLRSPLSSHHRTRAGASGSEEQGRWARAAAEATQHQSIRSTSAPFVSTTSTHQGLASRSIWGPRCVRTRQSPREPSVHRPRPRSIAEQRLLLRLPGHTTAQACALGSWVVRSRMTAGPGIRTSQYLATLEGSFCDCSIDRSIDRSKWLVGAGASVDRLLDGCAGYRVVAGWRARGRRVHGASHCGTAAAFDAN